MPTIKPFHVSVPDAAIENLRKKLELSSFPDETSFSDAWSYGAPLSDVKRLAARWRDGFNWRRQEAEINKLPQFTTTVQVDGFDDLGLHFVHQRSENEESIPLLFCHGWPGSFLEVRKILPLLTETQTGGPSFHVVAPSLPNYGFSGQVDKPGFGIRHYAEALHNLMLALGYERYVTQGGDWGFAVTRMMAYQFPSHCLASHCNFIRTWTPPSFTQAPLDFALRTLRLRSPTAGDLAGLRRTDEIQREGMGYNVLQQTKPATVGFALADSPVALLAWVYEKLRDWTHAYPWADDEILTWVSLYQFSRAGPAASVRIYYECVKAGGELKLKEAGYVPSVPFGFSCFPRDLVVPPRGWSKGLGRVVFERYHGSGGHFATHERPREVVQDLREMFGEGGGAHAQGQRTITRKSRTP